MRAKLALRPGAALFLLTLATILGSGDAGVPDPVPAGSRTGFRDASPFKGMSWTALGPKSAGGRIETIDAPPDSPGTIYVGAGSGGVWKTVNGGLTWTPLFDRGPTMAIGDLTVAPSDPDVVWVGTGESLMARSSFAGAGVFRSADGGRTWESRGLEDTHHIGRIVIDPKEPDHVYVAAIGHQYTFNEERGVFVTADGGRTWTRSLFVDERTGVVDLVMDPGDSRVLYAAAWERDRKAWNNTVCGPGSGIYRTTDGGGSWTRLSNGLPSGPSIGRIGLDACPAAPGVVYAFIDNLTPVPAPAGRKTEPAPAGGEVYRSDDRGVSWRKVNEGDMGAGTGYAFGDIRVSPKDANVVYVLGVGLVRSTDGGRTFTRLEGTVVRLSPLPTRALHLDQHELWIDPRDPDRLVLGNDGGLFLSNDAGRAWLHLNNLPVTEFYAASAGAGSPYLIYGGTQDNAAQRGRSDRPLDDAASDGWSHLWIDLWGGGDSYFTFPDPADPDVVYYEQQFGDLKRKDMRTGRTVLIRPQSGKGQKPYRFNWMTPFIISRHDPAVLYCGAERMFRSGDRGDHWTVLSADLSTAPGPDRQGDVPFGTITTIAESPLAKGLLFVGTDDGKVWMTGDDGAAWTPVDTGLPRKWVSRLEASPHDADRVYAALTGYREDDFRTYLFRSSDRGRTWESISGNLPPESVNVVREDPERPGLLYIGTDQGGVYVSADNGDTWSSLCADLPPAAVHDLCVQGDEDELVAATHGRGVFTLDIAPVREAAGAPAGENRLFPVKPARRPSSRDYRGDWIRETLRPTVIHFRLREAGRTTVAVVDEKGRTVKTLERETPAGVNSVSWDLVPDGPPARAEVYPSAQPLAEPGRYRVVVRSGTVLLEGHFEVLGPGGVPAVDKKSVTE
jgi:photosystem II stability/assembly factor-like uncharacterized protein